MSISNLQRILTPGTLAEASALLRDKPANTAIIAGGVSFMFTSRGNIEDLVSLANLNLNQIDSKPDGLHIGSTCLLTDIANHEAVRQYADGAVAQAAHRTGTSLNRNICTLGGILIHPFVWPELATAAVALNASFCIEGNEPRQIPAAEVFAQAPSALLKAGDILTELIFPPMENCTVSFEKFSQTHNEYPLLVLCLKGKICADGIAEVSIAAGGAAPLPQLLANTAQALEATPLSTQARKKAEATLAEELRVGRDIRCTEKYKRDLSAGLLRGMLEAQFGSKEVPS